MRSQFLCLAVSLVVTAAEVPETIYVPYSETEDVDFTIDRPTNVGCYQWTCEDEEVIELIPVNTDYTLMCGPRLEFKILPGTANPEGPTVLTIQAENVDMEYEMEEIQSVTYTVVVVPVARLEVLGMKTELRAGDEASQFGVAAYDAAGNELDTLDGVQLNWFIGARRDLARFLDTTSGPVVSLEPLGAGKGSLVCLISDPNYEKMEPGVLEFTVTARLIIEPDGLYLLPGGEARLGLFEQIHKGDARRNPLKIRGDLAEFSIVSDEEEIVRVDQEREVVIGGEPDDETSLLVKDLEGNIVKGVPIRTASPHRMEVRSFPHPESKQMIVNREYDIKITIFDKEGHEIFPSDNILTKTTFGKQFDIIDISVNGLRARVQPIMVGIGKIKASLRSTLSPDDEETEISPHIKGVTDFEIYEDVLVSPRRTILPWDSVTQPDYTLSYKVSGGGKVYKYQVDPDHLATVDQEGKVRVVGGPGLVTLTAGMSQSMHNNMTAKVVLAAPLELELPETGSVEWLTGHKINLPVTVFTLDPETKEKVHFTDCSDMKLTVSLSNTKDFSVEGQAVRGDQPRERNSCTSVHLLSETPGATTKVTVSYTLPDSGKQLTKFRHIAAYQSLEAVNPAPDVHRLGSSSQPQLVLPVGGSRKVVFKGGPQPWVGKPSFFYKDAESQDEDVVRATLVPDQPQPYTVAEVTCLKLGSVKVEVAVGNKPSATNKSPSFQRRQVQVHCSAPGKISKLEVKSSGQEGTKAPVVNPSTDRLMVYSYRDFKVAPTVKDTEGRTFDNVSSLQFTFTFSDPEMAQQGQHQTGSHQPIADLPAVLLPGKYHQIIHPNGLKGDLDIQVAVQGYRTDVLDSVGVTEPPPPLPSPPVAFEEFDEDYDYDEEDGEVVFPEQLGVAEELSLTLATDAEIEVFYDP